MDITIDGAEVSREATSPIGHALRIAMALYLSPVIFLVFAIGCVGVIASRLAHSPVLAGSRLAHAAHDGNPPAAIGKNPAQVRDLV